MARVDYIAPSGVPDAKSPTNMREVRHKVACGSPLPQSDHGKTEVEERPISSGHVRSELEEDSRSSEYSFVTVSEEPSFEWWTQCRALIGIPSPPPLSIPIEPENAPKIDVPMPPPTTNESHLSRHTPSKSGSHPSVPVDSASSTSSSSSSKNSSSSTSAASSTSSGTSSTITAPPLKQIRTSQQYLDEIFIPNTEERKTQPDAPLHSVNTPQSPAPTQTNQLAVDETHASENFAESRIDKLKGKWKEGRRTKLFVKQDGRQYRIIISNDGAVKVFLRTSASVPNIRSHSTRSNPSRNGGD
ncbi:uncharacterized protein [Musca autumnalis]|uniref:uncharacterized protein n=1 Tax=Musca autumnalis TaxID=221902 RepID=UPI003CF31D5A